MLKQIVTQIYLNVTMTTVWDMMILLLSLNYRHVTMEMYCYTLTVINPRSLSFNAIKTVTMERTVFNGTLTKLLLSNNVKRLFSSSSFSIYLSPKRIRKVCRLKRRKIMEITLRIIIYDIDGWKVWGRNWNVWTIYKNRKNNFFFYNGMISWFSLKFTQKNDRYIKCIKIIFYSR